MVLNCTKKRYFSIFYCFFYFRFFIFGFFVSLGNYRYPPLILTPEPYILTPSCIISELSNIPMKPNPITLWTKNHHFFSLPSSHIFPIATPSPSSLISPQIASIYTLTITLIQRYDRTSHRHFSPYYFGNHPASLIPSYPFIIFTYWLYPSKENVYPTSWPFYLWLVE